MQVPAFQPIGLVHHYSWHTSTFSSPRCVSSTSSPSLAPPFSLSLAYCSFNDLPRHTKTHTRQGYRVDVHNHGSKHLIPVLLGPLWRWTAWQCWTSITLLSLPPAFFLPPLRQHPSFSGFIMSRRALLCPLPSPHPLFSDFMLSEKPHRFRLSCRPFSQCPCF